VRTNADLPYMTTCYKVVRACSNGRLYSVSAEGHNALRYFKTRWTKAKVGGILVFSDPVRARNYARMGDAVYECQCKRPVKLPRYRFLLLGLNSASPEQIAKLWSIRRYSRKCEKLLTVHAGWLPGTLAFKEIKLTKLLSKPL